jgi:hypothetical protein
MKRHAAPIIAAILLLLPVLYVGSYLALVVPGGYAMPDSRRPGVYNVWVYYRWLPPRGGAAFWPLEQIDRKVRPRAWGREAKMRWMGSQPSSPM